MINLVHILVRGVIWKHIHTDTDVPYYDIFICRPLEALQANSGPSSDNLMDKIRTCIEGKTAEINGVTVVDYIINITDPNIVIWDGDSLRRIGFPKRKYKQEKTERLNRYEILDIRIE